MMFYIVLCTIIQYNVGFAQNTSDNAYTATTSVIVDDTTVSMGSENLPNGTCIAVGYSPKISNCSNRSLQSVPSELSSELEVVYLDNNNISYVKEDDFQSLSTVHHLSLNNNAIASLPANVFVNCTSLRSLNLSHNLLTSVSFVSGAPFLVELDVNNNRITQVNDLVNMSFLEVVDLSFNKLTDLPSLLPSHLPIVKIFKISNNLLTYFEVSGALMWNSLVTLDLSSNSITHFTVCYECHLSNLLHLDLSNNRLIVISPVWFRSFPSLLAFSASHNPVFEITTHTFVGCAQLEVLDLSHMFRLKYIERDAFAGLYLLKHLHLGHNPNLTSLHSGTFQSLGNLTFLDLSANGLTSLDQSALSHLNMLERLLLGNNPWSCDCDMKSFQLSLMSLVADHGVHIDDDIFCEDPPISAGIALLNASFDRFECLVARVRNPNAVVFVHIGQTAILDCSAAGAPPLDIIWVWNRKQQQFRLMYNHTNDTLAWNSSGDGRIFALDNGSLVIESVERTDAGYYYCLVSNEFGNATAVVSLRFNYECISIITLESIIIGLISAAGFFFVAVIIGVVRYMARVCSKKDKRKRKSIREVLDAIQDYKIAQFDKFSAYRTAKMDQLSAFKSATIGHLSAFRDARVDRIRTYKQATVTSILAHLERMREHYAAQTARIKENCAQQAERLMESYGTRCGRFKDYRSHQVDKMRENYAMQAARIREYGLMQMSRLREQYKTQQQHVLKLVELLDVGSCVTGVIEAECMRAESMIFDADIAFDFEAQPVHAAELAIGACGGDADSELSHYLTASDSDISLSDDVHNIACVVDITPISDADKCFINDDPYTLNAVCSVDCTETATNAGDVSKDDNVERANSCATSRCEGELNKNTGMSEPSSFPVVSDGDGLPSCSCPVVPDASGDRLSSCSCPVLPDVNSTGLVSSEVCNASLVNAAETFEMEDMSS